MSLFYRLPRGWWKVAYSVGILTLAAMGIVAGDDGG
jgi:hypothetical protein